MSTANEVVDEVYDEFGEDAALTTADGTTVPVVRVRRVAAEHGQQPFARTTFALSASRASRALAVQVRRRDLAGHDLAGAVLVLADGSYDVGTAEPVGIHGIEIRLPLTALAG
ncbi:hypothetical protein [Azospirillum picis]|uniref:Alpha/beta hydrolase n=1 Tax=Azospirillum picis TaxID=488438 RepID=A0ABU0MUJ8_9PROT|nr:hypothetical protein [Azospirillum picis]MBP2303323.1 putative alpha/beta hydrolase [Azospirillum picis]MDQ0537137.1 putative alpha/beta hydrolase [Azospirillum picis]